MPGPNRKPAEKPKNFKKTIKQLAIYIKPYYFRFLLALLLMVFSTILSVS